MNRLYKQLNNKLLSASLIAGMLSTTLLTGCDGGGGGGNSPEYVAPTVQGSGVKGPLVGAAVTVYLLDLDGEHLKGQAVGSASTNDQAQIVDLTIDEAYDNNDFFILEVTGGTDHNSNQAPAIATLRTIFSEREYHNLIPVYATPISTLILELAANNPDLKTAELVIETETRADPITLIESEFEVSREWVVTLDTEELQKAVNYVQSAFGGGLLGYEDFSLFLTAPIANDEGITQEAVNYRMASEAFSAVLVAIQEALAGIGSDISSDDLLVLLARDMSDLAIDGQDNGVDLAPLSSLAGIQGVITQNTNTMMLPGTTLMLSDMLTIMQDEAGTLALNPASPGVSQPVLGQFVVGIDTDGDLYADFYDAFPEDPNEWLDSDGDGTGDNGDYLPDNPNVQNICDDHVDNPATLLEQDNEGCFTDTDGDLVNDPLDDFPNNAFAWDTKACFTIPTTFEIYAGDPGAPPLAAASYSIPWTVEYIAENGSISAPLNLSVHQVPTNTATLELNVVAGTYTLAVNYDTDAVTIAGLLKMTNVSQVFSGSYNAATGALTSMGDAVASGTLNCQDGGTGQILTCGAIGAPVDTDIAVPTPSVDFPIGMDAPVYDFNLNNNGGNTVVSGGLFFGLPVQQTLRFGATTNDSDGVNAAAAVFCGDYVAP